MIRIIIITLFSLTFMGGLHYYLWRKLVRNTKLTEPWRRRVTVSLVLSACLIVFSMFIARSGLLSFLKPVTIIFQALFAIVLVAFTLFLISDLLKLFAYIITKPAGAGAFWSDSERSKRTARVVSIAVLVCTPILTAYGMYNALAVLVTRHVEIRLEELPPAFDGFRIVHLTDLHLGGILQKKWAARITKHTNELKPDLIAVTGDLVNSNVEELDSMMAPLAGLEAPQGKFFVTGNHEYYAGTAHWLPEIEKLGLRILRNEHVTISKNGQSFILAGIDGKFSHSFTRDEMDRDVDTALQGTAPENTIILLTHQSRVVKKAHQRGVDLLLAGHTHGGQIWPWSYLVKLQQPFICGLHLYNDHTYVYTGDGSGFWGIPLRIGTVNEITVITLRAANNKRVSNPKRD